tara:strand:- start:2574 stop:2831 length:258 start_codon:yes stop_codon:yes gene_type:complete
MTKDNNEIKWQCRRGLWELDIMLAPFAEYDYPALSSKHKQDFRDLISHEDVDLLNWLVSRIKTDIEKDQEIINQIILAHENRLTT